MKDNVDAKFLSTKTAGGFAGNFYAFYATYPGKKSANKVYFSYFESKSIEDMYK